MLRASSSRWMQRNCINDANKTNGAPMSVGITDQPTTACSICRADASSWSHISRLMVITIYHPGVTHSGVYTCMCSSMGDSLSRAMFIYIRLHTRHRRCTRLRRSRVENTRDERTSVSVWNDRGTHKLRATKQARITVFKGRIVAICRLQP